MKIVGHRGARGLAPENTLAALQKALEHLEYGVDMIEFDVRVSKDKLPVLHHDSFAVLNDKRLQISEHSFAELQEMLPDITTLETALSYIDTKVTPYIEVKQGVEIGPIVKVIKDFIGTTYGGGDLLIGSKSQRTLRALHTALPEVPLIVIEPWSSIRAVWRARQLTTKLVAMNQHWLWSGVIHSFASRGYELYAYTLNDVRKTQRWAKSGLAGPITDYPDRFH